MSASLKTSNYNLPLFIENDIPSWLVDWNNAMTSIDTIVKQAAQEGTEATEAVANLTNSVNAINNTLVNVNNSIVNLTKSVGDLPFTIKNNLSNYEGVCSSYSGFTNENNLGWINYKVGLKGTPNKVLPGTNIYPFVYCSTKNFINNGYIFTLGFFTFGDVEYTLYGLTKDGKLYIGIGTAINVELQVSASGLITFVS